MSSAEMNTLGVSYPLSPCQSYHRINLHEPMLHLPFVLLCQRIAALYLT
jgi:hypothetical protein